MTKKQLNTFAEYVNNIENQEIKSLSEFMIESYMEQHNLLLEIIDNQTFLTAQMVNLERIVGIIGVNYNPIFKIESEN